jgi:hypothetical protein
LGLWLSWISAYHTFETKKTDTFAGLRLRIQETTQIPSDDQIFWVMDGEKAIHVKGGMEKLPFSDVLGSASNRIVVLNKNEVSYAIPKQVDMFDMLVLVRMYSPVNISLIEEKSSVEFVGVFLASSSLTCSYLISSIEEKLNLGQGLLSLYFMKNDDIAKLNPRMKSKEQGLVSGGVLCGALEGFSVSEEYPFPTLSQWYHHVNNRIQLHLCSLDGDLSKSALINMDLSMSYAEVVAVISSFLNLSPEQFVLVGHDPIRRIPKARPFLSHEASSLTLRNMLTTMAQVLVVCWYLL